MDIAQPQMPIKRGRGRPPKDPSYGGMLEQHQQQQIQQVQAQQAAAMQAQQNQAVQPDNGQVNQSRDFVCQMCGKTYLSSPALYLHMKIKHQQGEGKPIGPMPGRGRGRGRPKKDTQYEPGYHNNQKLDPTGEMFLRAENRIGGPTDPMTGFGDSINLLFPGRYVEFSQHPMNEFIEKFSFGRTPLEYPQDDGKTKQEMMEIKDGRRLLKLTFADVSSEIQVLSETKRNMLTADEIFVLYMRDCSQMVNEGYYRQIVQFILMFSDCLNQYGWQKRAEHECKEYYGQYDYEQKLRERMDEFEVFKQATTYCQVNNCEFAPEICNEFVTIYLDEPNRNMGRLLRSEIIDLTQHLCHWLFTNRLTCSKLSMVGS